MEKYYVYILSNYTNTTLYIWVTSNLDRRIYQHQEKDIKWFTEKYNCTKLVYYEEYSDINEAITREKQLKRWGRKKKDWLIDQDNAERKNLFEEKQISPFRFAAVEMTRVY